MKYCGQLMRKIVVVVVVAYGLFNDAVSSRDYKASNYRAIMNYELKVFGSNRGMI
jgi:hypothetical protein